MKKKKITPPIKRGWKPKTHYKQQSIVSGLKIKDILNMSIDKFNKLTEKDLRKIVGRLVSAGNKRLRNFEKNEESSPATRYIEKSGGKFTTKGKNLNQLRAEYMRAKNFLESKTSTRAGWKKVKRETSKGLKGAGINLSENQFNDVWKTFEKLKEISPEVANLNLKYITLKEISDIISTNNYTSSEIVERVTNKLSEIYEQRERIENNVNGVSDFFVLE